MRQATYILGMLLALTVLAVRSEAQLGCFDDGGSDPPLATCAIAADCAPVGGVDCTGGACFCPTGVQAPFCLCLATQPAAAAPLLSGGALIGMVSLLCAIGIIGLLRRGGARREVA